MKKRHILLRSSVLFLILILQPQSTLAGNCKGEQFRQLLRDLMNDAELQVKDALYPITRYAGMGYNLLRGNPEGDFFNGGKDPGIHNTRWILNLTYTQNKEGHYRGQTVAIPDQVEFHPTRTCFARSMTKAFSGQSSYQDQLKRNIKLGLSGMHHNFCVFFIEILFKIPILLCPLPLGGYAKLAELGFSLSSGIYLLVLAKSVMHGDLKHFFYFLKLSLFHQF